MVRRSGCVRLSHVAMHASLLGVLTADVFSVGVVDAQDARRSSERFFSFVVACVSCDVPRSITRHGGTIHKCTLQQGDEALLGDKKVQCLINSFFEPQTAPMPGVQQR